MWIALRGLLAGYALILLGWLYALKLAPRILPDMGVGGVLLMVGLPLIIMHGVALAIFGGSAFCSGRALYRESAARTFAGYVIFVLSTISVVCLGILWLRALVFAR
jgi:hypothetical protein